MRDSPQSKSAARRDAIITEQVCSRSRQQGALAAPFSCPRNECNPESRRKSAKAAADSVPSPLRLNVTRPLPVFFAVRRPHRSLRVSTDEPPETESRRARQRPCRCCRCATWSCTRTWSSRCSSAARNRSSRSTQAMKLGQADPAGRAEAGGRRRSRGRRICTASAPIATILQLLKLPDGTVKVLVEGVERAQHREPARRRVLHRRRHAARADVEHYDEREMDVLARSVISQFEQYVKLNRKVPPEDPHRARRHRAAGPARRHRRRAHVAQARRQAEGSGDPGRAQAPRAHPRR